RSGYVCPPVDVDDPAAALIQTGLRVCLPRGQLFADGYLVGRARRRSTQDGIEVSPAGIDEAERGEADGGKARTRRLRRRRIGTGAGALIDRNIESEIVRH